jgi:hypothetical protein
MTASIAISSTSREATAAAVADMNSFMEFWKNNVELLEKILPKAPEIRAKLVEYGLLR